MSADATGVKDAEFRVERAVVPGDKPTRRRRRRRALTITLIAIVGLIALVTTAFVVSPWPGALVVRTLFERDAAQVLEKMQPFAPGGVTVTSDESYRANDPDALFDIYFPDGTDEPLPTVVWIHGGAWISGSKNDGGPYFELLAAEGYTVVSLGYTIAPEATYPTALNQLNDAFGYLIENADRLNIDPTSIAIAGDSAGSQYTTQLAALTTSPEYASLVGVTPSIAPDQLKGVILNCGIYDIPRMLLGTGLVGWGVDQSIWSYVGTLDYESSEPVAQMSTIHQVTDAFPPAFITGGNGDPLTDSQSKPLAEKLEGLGVDVSTLFWPADLEPSLPHEYQFKLERPEAQAALEQTIEFMATVLD